jgi:hypothetical protein
MNGSTDGIYKYVLYTKEEERKMFITGKSKQCEDLGIEASTHNNTRKAIAPMNHVQ